MIFKLILKSEIKKYKGRAATENVQLIFKKEPWFK